MLWKVLTGHVTWHGSRTLVSQVRILQHCVSPVSCYVITALLPVELIQNVSPLPTIVGGFLISSVITVWGTDVSSSRRSGYWWRNFLTLLVAQWSCCYALT